jgi:hypothetical protein
VNKNPSTLKNTPINASIVQVLAIPNRVSPAARRWIASSRWWGVRFGLRANFNGSFWAFAGPFLISSSSNSAIAAHGREQSVLHPTRTRYWSCSQALTVPIGSRPRRDAVSKVKNQPCSDAISFSRECLVRYTHTRRLRGSSEVSAGAHSGAAVQVSWQVGL